MLKGAELLEFIKQNPDLTKTELAKAAGYVRNTEDGKEQVLLQTFYDAAFEAHGTPLKSGRGLQGKTAQYQTTIHKSGILLVGKTYIDEFGGRPGDVFGIEVREDGIWLPLKERDAAVLCAADTASIAAPVDAAPAAAAVAEPALAAA